jgi:hypothetical protein
MTYNDLAKTFEILAAHMPNGMVLDWAKRDQWGIKLKGFDLTPSEIRTLAEMGWCLGSDIEYNEKEMAAWNNPQTASDEELVELFNNYKSIYQYTAYII